MTLLAIAPGESGLEAGGHAKGVGIGIVRQNRDDGGQGRVKVSYPWHSEPRESYWARIAVPMAGGERGTYFLPEVGDEVLVAFERGDLRFPYVIGALWNGVDRPPDSNDDGRNDRRVIRSRKGHVLVFDDGAKGAVRLALDDGKRVVLDDEGIRVEDGQGNALRIDSRSGALTVEARGALTLKGASVRIEATGSIDVKAGGLLGLNGAMVNIN
ncbi:phage baseplate assembly protein V [Variovorax sp. J2P1-59]|uniref:phage baseplate assembly protein V n=1 Tax=Variovorax flavidus TaxID=3053501 RepID=UPI00257671CD|nr:phage baseplate assembly protein V [Variovorax sp. J2P1-59]MDM0076897.1 phage baseplate assembly protein V [Variovorax sp. J2P1-59]